MITAVRIIGVGHPSAGDDAVGLVVARRVRALAHSTVEVFEIVDPSRLIPLLFTPSPVVIVDAVLGAGAVGHVVVFDAEVPPTGCACQPVSSHGLDVRSAVGLARLVSTGPMSPRISIVGVTISKPVGFSHGLSGPVEASVERAALTALEVARADSSPAPAQNPTAL